MPAAVIPAAIGGITGIVKGIKSARQNSMANKVVIPDANYEVSPYAKQMLATANQFKNSRMQGAAEAEQNIMGNQANAVGSIERNATSGAQALSMVAAAQGNSNNAFGQLRQQEGADMMGKINNQNMAMQQMIGEDDKMFQDRLRKQQMAMQEKASLRGAANANFDGALKDVTTGVMESAKMYEKQNNG